MCSQGWDFSREATSQIPDVLTLVYNNFPETFLKVQYKVYPRQLKQHLGVGIGSQTSENPQAGAKLYPRLTPTVPDLPFRFLYRQWWMGEGREEKPVSLPLPRSHVKLKRQPNARGRWWLINKGSAWRSWFQYLRPVSAWVPPYDTLTRGKTEPGLNTKNAKCKRQRGWSFGRRARRESTFLFLPNPSQQSQLSSHLPVPSSFNNRHKLAGVLFWGSFLY